MRVASPDFPTPPESQCSAARPAAQAAPIAYRPLRVVMIDEELPYPPNSGKRIRTLNLTLRLARRHRITYVCHRNAEATEAERAAAFFRDHGIQPVIVDRTVPPRAGLAFYARLAANLLSSLPYSVASHRSQPLGDALRAQGRAHPVDLWHCEWTPYAEALGFAHGGRRLVMAHNVESLIWRRYHEVEPSRLRRWYIKRQWRKFERFERRALTDADQTVAVSPVDAAVFAEHFGVRHVRVVDNGVDTSWFRPGAGTADPRRVLFLGSLDWRPNLDAVDQLLTRVFPAIRAAVPDARLWLVGRHPPDALRRQVFGFPNVELHADVADVRPFLNGAGVLAVPLRIGGGSRLKILEALACGVPVVSTRIGAEGLCLEPGRHLTVVESVDDMAAALVDAVRFPGAALAQAAAGRQRVLESYDWDVLADKLEQAWLECVGPSAVESAARAGGRRGMNIVHLTASTLFGGPERQILGLAEALAGRCRSTVLSFAEGGRSRAFVCQARARGIGAAALEHDTPRLRAATGELAAYLRHSRADVLLCNGYKASLVGRVAARRVGLPVVAVSRGWTAENWKVRLYEVLDRLNLRWMDRVVCVSEGQATKVRRAGVSDGLIVVIRNAIRADRFEAPEPAYRERLLALFPEPPRRVIGAAGRLSPEKGFAVLVEAARRVLQNDAGTGIVLFGDGPLRPALERQIAASGLAGHLVLAGFRDDLDRYLPWLDVLVLPSYTEGLPNVALEASAAGVPVVATAVGGTPEVIEHEVNGYLVPPEDPEALAAHIVAVLDSPDRGREMGRSGRRRMQETFTFAAQADQYARLFAEVTGDCPRTRPAEPALRLL